MYRCTYKFNCVELMDGLVLIAFLCSNIVLVLSAHSDTELVKKGVFHGACDYLLKPVRIEELKNIWQHVLRRKTSSAKNQNECTNGNDTLCQTVEVVKGFPSVASADNGKPGKRRKDDDDDEEGGEEESAYETDDSSSQKKQRVVWFGELHRKFIAAVNHLGYESMSFGVFLGILVLSSLFFLLDLYINF